MFLFNLEATLNEHALPKTYDFKSTEERIYAWWEQQGFFQPANAPARKGFDPTRKPFVISIPPPNVTGELHLGHAMFVAMEDLMIRYNRMKGVPTLWLPGMDHAGIATQLKVEEDLLRTEEVTRDELGREAFLERTWAWKEKYHAVISQQIRRLGASCDWSRERFTLDEGLSVAVREAFVRLYEKGLIYRGPRLINWSPGLRTAVSDLEVEYSEEEGRLYYFKYPLKGLDDFIPVATTRPETILADTAVAVNPEDERYQRFVGRKALVPMLGREIPVIADEYVDREFGTGALKITPGHDTVDYQIGARHNLPVISLLDEAAHLTKDGGPYAGMERFAARKKIWADLQAAGLAIKTVTYTQRVPRSQRGGEIIEPMISTQWFVTIKPLAEPALAAVEDGRVQIVPAHFTKVYRNWMANIQDWCISRQLWWGHRIPVWYAPDGSMFCARSEEEALAQAKKQFGKPVELTQDPDVLDTWFSSGLWPFSTLGWPEESADLKYFYPTSVLETGYDILFFWVARMIMLGLEFTGKAPFHTVYLHGLVRDDQGRKMSKTLGNVIDPLEVMDQYGTDALRFTLLVGSTPGQDVNLSLEKVGANRNFANKLWNAGRFVIGALASAPKKTKGELDPTLADAWIWARTKQVLTTCSRLFETHQYGEAGRQVYDFFWSEFADWYIEIAKLQLGEGGERANKTAHLLVRVMDTCLRLLHPYTPFVTEELWSHLKAAAQEHSLGLGLEKNGGWPEALIVAPWPEPVAEGAEDSQAVKDFATLQSVVRAIRNQRAEKNVKPGKKLTATLASSEHFAMLEKEKGALCVLAQLDPEELNITSAMGRKPEGHISLMAGPVEIYFSLADAVDASKERDRLGKELAAAREQAARLEKLLNSDFGKKAPKEVVEKEKERLAGFMSTAKSLEEQLKNLK
ncbi:MAG: valine--tRNA ligase [Anaerolineales bacterium]